MENEIKLEMLGVLFSSDGHSKPHVDNIMINAADHFIVWVVVVYLLHDSMWILKNIYGIACVCRHWNMAWKQCTCTSQIKKNRFSARHSFEVWSFPWPECAQPPYFDCSSNWRNYFKKTVCGLLNRIFMVDSPMRDLCSHFMARYIVSGNIYPKPYFPEF